MSAQSVDSGNKSVNSTVGGTAILTGRTLRKGLIVQNLGTADVYLGASGVTTSTGLKVASGSSMPLDGFVGGTLFGITASGTADVRWLGVF